MARLRKGRAAAFWRGMLFCGFWLYIAFFPSGYGWREVMPPLCFIFVLLYWKHDWKNSTLARLRVWPLFIFFALMLLVGVAFSRDPWASLLHTGTGLNKAYILPFIAMECAHTEEDLKNLVWAFVLACFWEGVDGVWQALHGFDFVMGYTPNAGRLTGSLGDYTVGNYLALALIPAAGVWYILRGKMDFAVSAFLMLALFWPACFLFQGASSRSGILALVVSAALWCFLGTGRINWRIALYPAALLGLFMICQPGRIGFSSTIDDNRWDLWRLAWRVFQEYPVFGAGAGQYNAAFQSLGLAPEREVITISHPHDLYLDMLYAHGLVGFLLGMVFIGGFLAWGWRKLRPKLLEEKGGNRVYWKLGGLFWLAYAAWLVNGIFGHDFYRTWWLAQAMIALGIMAGAIVNGESGSIGPAMENTPNSHGTQAGVPQGADLHE